jgi:hypothetical protein
MSVLEGWRPVPLKIITEPEHGGRWTSLRAGDREWLWTNPDPEVLNRRRTVQPGDPFTDAGGVEECCPTVRGLPDHGDAWTRRWQAAGSGYEVLMPGSGRLRRQIADGPRAVIDYEMSGPRGGTFLHAVHALVDVSPRARLAVPAARSMTVLDVADRDRPWPSGLDRLGPDDGTAVCALLTDCREAVVIDGLHALRLAWDAEESDRCSLLLWRNLRGWPAERPYRSIGIEPMVGRAADLSTAQRADCVELGPSGVFTWRLEVTGFRK